jgi:hypothetical protein
MYLFPSSDGHRGKDKPMSDRAIWYACKEAARYAGITKHVKGTRLPLVSAEVKKLRFLMTGNIP